MFGFLKKLFGGTDFSKNSSRVILVMDDGVVERKFMTATLSKKGYKVITAPNGEEGIKLAIETNPDVIYLDFAMPGMTGKEVCAKLKNDVRTKDIPIVFLSGSVSPGKVIECYDVGAEYYLAKPINAATLLEHTRLLLEEADLVKKQGENEQS